MAYGSSLCKNKKICRTGNISLHFPLLFPARFYYDLITEWSDTLWLLFGALRWALEDQSLSAFQGLNKACDNSRHPLRRLFMLTCSIMVVTVRGETNIRKHRHSKHTCADSHTDLMSSRYEFLLL